MRIVLQRIPGDRLMNTGDGLGNVHGAQTVDQAEANLKGKAKEIGLI